MRKIFIKNVSNNGKAILINTPEKKITLGDGEQREIDMPPGVTVVMLDEGPAVPKKVSKKK